MEFNLNYQSNSSSNSSYSSSSDSPEEEESSQNPNMGDQIMAVGHMIAYASEYVMPQVTQYTTPYPPRTRNYIYRDRESSHDTLIRHYFASFPTYTPELFRRRFRMDRPLFLSLVEAAMSSGDRFFQHLPDCTGRLGCSPLLKCTAAMRMLAYGTAADCVDEYLQVSETTACNSLEKFCDVVIATFGEKYLRKAEGKDLDRLKKMGVERGFPGMLGSIDCMHWQWKNCPTGYKAQYQGRSGEASIVLEAVASHDLWIWHSFFGVPGSLNDVNVLQRSPVFDDVLNGVALATDFVVNNHHYDMGYYLTDGIYPHWATFIPSHPLPQTPKLRKFAETHEANRKDVERAFGVLQARFAIIRNPALAWSQEILSKIMTACIIMHNMIVEDERDRYANYDDDSEFWADKPKKRKRRRGVARKRTDVEHPERIIHTRVDSRVNQAQYMARRSAMQDKIIHNQLKKDLIEHVWAHT